MHAPLQDLMPKSTDLPAGLLYHYTSMEGLLGIIQSGKMRATHVRFLNDSSEFMHAFSPAYMDRWLEGLIPGAGEELKLGVREKAVSLAAKYVVFVISLTEDEPTSENLSPSQGDRLSQWQKYTPRNGGFSLGFDVSLSANSFDLLPLRRAKGAVWFYRCIYGETDKQALFKELGDNGLAFAHKIYASESEQFVKKYGRVPNPQESSSLIGKSALEALSSTSAGHLIRAGQLKDGSFQEEREWRALFIVEKNELLEAHNSDPQNPILFFRVGAFGLTPYIEYPLNLNSDNCPLRRIVVGPCPYPEEAVDSVQLLLAANGIKGIEVVKSETPFRRW